jgi:hypothetical protein
MAEPRVGNIYKAKGGRDTKFWLLVSIKRRVRGDLLSGTACLLGLDDHFNIVSAQSYGLHALLDRNVVGWVDVSTIKLLDVPYEE